MIDPKLNNICKQIDAWCQNHHVQYDIVCDEPDIQGILLFKKNQSTLEDLVRTLYPSILEGNIFVQTKVVRGGVVMAFSLNALSESQLKTMVENAGHTEGIMTFRDKIDSAFNIMTDITHRATEMPSNLAAKSIDFTTSAMGLVKEAQRKSPTTAARRRLDRSSINDLTRRGTRGPASQSNNRCAMGASKGSSKGSAIHSTESRLNFTDSLNEALSGLATADGRQPGELFEVFARALRVLGTKLGVGPLQDKLQQQGISWKQSDDGQSIILTIKNAKTNTEQPIATINYETLQTPTDFEEQLKNMLDLATGQAPGAFTAQEKAVQDQKGTIRDIAKAIKPQDQQGEVAQLMNQNMDAGKAAATTAALPKEGLENKLVRVFKPAV